MVREITGTGEGNGPMISFHDGFDALKNWANFLPGADRIVIGTSSCMRSIVEPISPPILCAPDDHPYFAFDGQPNREPVNITADGGDGTQLGGKWPLQACNAWGANMNTRSVPTKRVTLHPLTAVLHAQPCEFRYLRRGRV